MHIYLIAWLPQELSTDSSQHVRSALASVIMGMAPVLGKVCISTGNDYSFGERSIVFLSCISLAKFLRCHVPTFYSLCHVYSPAFMAVVTFCG